MQHVFSLVFLNDNIDNKDNIEKRNTCFPCFFLTTT